MHRMRFSSPSCCLTDVDPKQQLAEASSGLFRLEEEGKRKHEKGTIRGSVLYAFPGRSRI
jgi:hypothetical protein